MSGPASGVAGPRLGRDVFTTGQVARICCVATRTVAKWSDAGLLRGWRLPGSGDRRIGRGDLVRFLRDRRLPVPPDLAGPAAAGVHLPPGWGGLADLAPVDAGVRAARGELAAVLVGCAAGLGAAAAACRSFAAAVPWVRLALLLSEDRAPADVPTGLPARVFPWDADPAAVRAYLAGEGV